MKSSISLSVFAIALLASGVSAACSCSAREPDKELWLKRVTSEAQFVFLAKANRSWGDSPPTTSEYVAVEILQQLKGKAVFTQLVADQCASAPKTGQIVVLFVDARGAIVPCTWYLHFAQNEWIIDGLRRLQKTHAQ